MCSDRLKRVFLVLLFVRSLSGCANPTDPPSSCEDWLTVATCEGTELVVEHRMYPADCGNDEYTVVDMDRAACEHFCAEPVPGQGRCTLEEDPSDECGDVRGEHCAGDMLITCDRDGYITETRACEEGCTVLNEGRYGMAYCDEELSSE